MNFSQIKLFRLSSLRISVLKFAIKNNHVAIKPKICFNLLNGTKGLSSKFINVSDIKKIIVNNNMNHKYTQFNAEMINFFLFFPPFTMLLGEISQVEQFIR